jgi:hypothetical protein
METTNWRRPTGLNSKTGPNRATYSLQELAAAVGKVAHHAPARLAEDCIQTNAIPAFVDEIKHRQRLNMAFDRFLNNILKLHDAKTTAGPPPRLGDVRVRAPRG